MRHRVYGKHLGRNKDQRTALFRQLVQSLILHGSIETTETKAKAIKGLVDKIINQAKSKNTQRLLQSFFNAKEIREKLIKEIAPSLKDRTSGYTSAVKMGQRLGDNAMIVRMSLLRSDKGEVKSEKSNRKEKILKATPNSEKKAVTGRSARFTQSGRRGSSRSSK